VRTVVAAASNGRRKASAANRRHFFPLLDIDWLSGDKDEYQDVKKKDTWAITLSRWKIVHVLQHKSLFNGWRLHAACMYSANVIDPPPCSTRPSKHSSAASVLLHLQGVLLVVGEPVFLPFPPLPCSLAVSSQTTSSSNTNKTYTTEHQPFNN
jgi:hypothetical protein